MSLKSNSAAIMVHLNRATDATALGLATTVFDRAVMRTPVRTRRLQASWVLSSGDTLTAPHKPLGVYADAPRAPKLDGRVFTIINTTPYASAVENGGPRNAAVHMLASAFEEAIR